MIYLRLFLQFHLSVFMLVGGLTGVGMAETVVNAPLSFPPCPVKHVTDAMMAQDGSIWVVGEKSNIYRLTAGTTGEGSWFDTRYFSDYPDIDDWRCIAQDRQGRVWVGSHNSGVAVCNGSSWKTYDRTTALAGNHVYDIAVSPLSGEVAIATSGGVTLYDPQKDSWRDLARAEGLVEDQVESLAFGQDGSLWLAYSCGGVSRGKPENGYSQWETTQAPWCWDGKTGARQPFKPEGDGLPSNLCNAILADEDGGVTVGTCAGLASFNQDKKAWRYVRGHDYLAKNKGLYEARSSNKSKPSDGSLLNEDYVTSLAKTDRGLLVGFRSKGAALVQPKTLRILKRFQGDDKKPLPSPYVTALVPLPDGTLLGGTYGGGVALLQRGKGTWNREDIKEEEYPAFPRQAAPLPLPEITSRIQALKDGLKKTKNSLCFFNNEDWETRGNWCERYGRDYALLCAINAPFDVLYNLNSHIIISGEMGWQHGENDSLRRWVHWVDVPKKKDVLFCPTICNRIEGEWDDHGEVYPPSMDGPDVWAKIILPKGRFQVSLYFFNPNGREKATASRDYLVEIRHEPAIVFTTPDKLLQKLDIYYTTKKELLRIRNNVPVARTRVRHFASGGVYKNFIMEGDGVYYIKVCRNNSFNTILNGIFVTQLEEQYREKKLGTHYLEYASVFPRKRDISPEQDSPAIAAYRSLEGLFREDIRSNRDSSLDRTALHLYRHHLAENSPSPDLLYNLRWDLKIWDKQEQEAFDQTMLSSWYALQDCHSIFWSKKWNKFSPRTIDFSPEETAMMRKLQIDWKEYLPGKKTEEEVNAMHELLDSKIKEHNKNKKIDKQFQQNAEKRKRKNEEALKKLYQRSRYLSR